MQVRKLAFENSTEKNILLVIEPHYDEYTITPGMRVEVRALRDADQDMIVVDYLNDRIVIWDWCPETEVYHNGEIMEPYT